MKMNIQVIHGNNIDVLKQIADNTIDAIVTDAPYGLGKEPNAEELMKDWIEKGYHEINGTGFMGKEWDAFVPQPIFWKEVFRVLKHGGHVVSFFGTRTYDWGVMAMRFAGFEVRDCIQWIYGSGFPKSHNIGKAIDKLEGNERKEIEGGQSASSLGNNKTMDGGIANKNYKYTKGDSAWEGWGSALKPANEPIVLARKPLEKGLSIAENVLKWGTGGINIDGCRITTNDDLAKNYNSIRKSDDEMGERGYKMGFRQGKDSYAEATESTSLGRFPANLILSHHPECTLNGLKKVKGTSTGNGNAIVGEQSNGVINPIRRGKFIDKTDENGEETIEDWTCHEDCPIKILDEQSGVSKSGKNIEEKGLGRFPANLILSHHPECTLNGLKKVKGVTGGKNDIVVDSKFGQVSNIPQKPFDYADENGEETIEDWTCHEDCPIKIMDEQSGVSKSGKNIEEKGTGGIWQKSSGLPVGNQYGDTGGASRFFYCPKASKSERNNGLNGFEEKVSQRDEGQPYGMNTSKVRPDGSERKPIQPKQNFHPTLKPVKLMQYLVRLITPPNGKVLDPFCGSGTTGIACKLEGFEFVGIEQDAEYCKIAEARIANYQEEPEKPLKFIEEEDKPRVIQQTLF